MVELSHWLLWRADNDGERYGRGPHQWCLYAYVYKEHPLFAALADANADEYEVTRDMPLHGGQTFYERHYDKNGAVVSVKVGCDYAHLGDENYSRIAPDGVNYMLYDAQRLYDWLQTRSTKEET